MKSSKIIKSILILMISLLMLFYFLSNTSYAQSSKLVTSTNSAFKRIERSIINISTPIAAVTAGIGFLMKKFSFGEEEKIRTANKIIRGTLLSYALILSIDLILDFIKVVIR